MMVRVAGRRVPEVVASPSPNAPSAWDWGGGVNMRTRCRLSWDWYPRGSKVPPVRRRQGERRSAPRTTEAPANPTDT